MFLGVIGSILFGAVAPVQCILMGELVDDFVDFTLCRNTRNCTDPPDLEDSMTTIGVYNMSAWLSQYPAISKIYERRLTALCTKLYNENRVYEFMRRTLYAT
jgi:hypothetical protein